MAGHHYENQQRMGPELCRRLDDLAISQGACCDSYLTMETDREYLWSPEHDGVIGFVRLGRHFKVVGGVLAVPEQRAALLRLLIAYVKERRGTLAFYNIGESDLSLFEAENFCVTKWGEEAVLDLPERTWAGKDFGFLRQQANVCRRKGLVVAEIKTGPSVDEPTARLHDELLEIERLCLQLKPQASATRFIQASLRPGRTSRQRIFAARSNQGAGRIEAFIVIFPGQSGQIWNMEIYRRRPDDVPRTLLFLIHETANRLKSEGAFHLSLGFIPALRCGTPRKGDSAFTRRGLQVCWKWFGSVFDLKGVYFFKSRFRPLFRNLYCCTWPPNKVAIGSTVAFFRLWGVTRIHPLRTLKIFARQVFVVRKERKSLDDGCKP